jgi:hypothetical protein
MKRKPYQTLSGTSCTHCTYTSSRRTKTSTYRGREEGGGGQGVLHEGALHDVGLTADGRQQPAGEDLAGVGLRREQSQHMGEITTHTRMDTL